MLERRSQSSGVAGWPQLAPIELFEGLSIELHAAARRPVHSAHDVQQCRFATPGWAPERDQFTPFDGERNSAERRDALVRTGVGFVKISNEQMRHVEQRRCTRRNSSPAEAVKRRRKDDGGKGKGILPDSFQHRGDDPRVRSRSEEIVRPSGECWLRGRKEKRPRVRRIELAA